MMNGRTWSGGDVVRLRKLLGTGVALERAAQILGRTVGECEAALARQTNAEMTQVVRAPGPLSLPRAAPEDVATKPAAAPAFRRNEQDATIVAIWRDGHPLADIMERLGLSKSTVRWRIKNLRRDGADLPDRRCTWSKARWRLLEQLWADPADRHRRRAVF